jgi:hypothetical protein
MSQVQRDWIRVDLDHIPEDNRKMADDVLCLRLLARPTRAVSRSRAI